MERQVRLLVASVVLSIGVVSGAASAAYAADPCTEALARAGICTSGTSDGAGVNVAGSIEQNPGGSGAHGGAGSGAGHVLTDAERAALLDAICVSAGQCDVRSAAALNPLIVLPDPGAGGAAATTPAVTIDDLARFLPATAALHVEPNGWAVVGVPANFWIESGAVTVSGALLGDTAQVRFTPQAYRFDYGDGSSRTSAIPGASWAALRRPELTTTPTSHVYGARADVRATGTAVYTAAYRFADGPWIGVSGAVSGSTPPQRVLVVTERTALTRPG